MSAGSSTALARQSIARHSRSFALAARFFPGELRDRASVLYAWCRRADDAVDHAPRGQAGEALARLREELAEVYAGRGWLGGEPLLVAFGQVVHACAVPRAYPEALLDGMEMDVRGTRYRTVDELYAYCWRVAGVVGVMMSHVMGVRAPGARRAAAQLGMAMQLTNICRDVDEDWRMGRLYLPEELLVAGGGGALLDAVRDGSPPPPGASRPVAFAVRHLLGHADRGYRAGDLGLAALPWRARVAVRTARLLYAAIGEQLAARDHDALAGRVVVPRGRKLVLAARALGAGLLELPGDLWRGFEPAPLNDRLRFPDDVLPL